MARGSAVDRSKISANQHLAVSLRCDRAHQPVGTAAGVKAEVQRTIRVESGEMIPAGGIEVQEGAAKQHLAIRLRRDRHHNIIRPGARIESTVQIAVRVKSRDSIEVDAIDRREFPAENDCLIRLQGH